MSATVHLQNGTSIVFDAIKRTEPKGERAVLLSLEGRVPGTVLNCAIIPIASVRAVVASLELVLEEARKQ